MSRKTLSEILQQGKRETLAEAWQTTQAAGEPGLLPRGTYISNIVGGELFKSKNKQTAGYKITFEIIDGEYAGRKVWLEVWLTSAALPMAKRDLAKIGVTSLDDLDKPVPRGIRCEVDVVVHKVESGEEYNHVRRFSVIGIDRPESDPFAPVSSDSQLPESTPTATAAPVGTDEPDGDTSSTCDQATTHGEGQSL